MILLAYKYIRLLLVIILTVTPVQDVFAGQNMHCDTQSSEYKNLQNATLALQTIHQQHCAHATESMCQCDPDNCHCTAVTHFFLHSLINSFQFPVRHSLSADTYLAHKTDVYISLTLRPPISIFS